MSRVHHGAPPLAEWRRPGCTFACVGGRGIPISHSPDAHEAYGRQSVFDEIAADAARPTGTITTGRLAVDFTEYEARVDGARVHLTPNELAILLEIAAHLGEIRTHDAITRAVWGEDYVAGWSRPWGRRSRWHGVRVNIARVRRKLGPAGDVLETVPGVGYRLRLVAACETDSGGR